MARIQPVLTKSETELVDQVADLTQTKRTDVIKNALAVYYWFVRNILTGARVVARKPRVKKWPWRLRNSPRLRGKAAG